MNVFKQFLNEELGRTNGPRLIEGTITETRPHFHRRALGGHALLCPGCGKVYVRFEPEQLAFFGPPHPIRIPEPVEEILPTGPQLALVFCLSFVSTMSFLTILHVLGERLL